MRVAFFEDHATSDLAPLALLRPTFELLCGHYSARERLLRHLEVSDWGAWLRPQLAPVYREEHPEAHLNDELWLRRGPTLLINGRWIADPRLLGELEEDEVGLIGETVVYLTLDPLEAPLLASGHWNDVLGQLARGRRRVAARGALIERPWDLVNHNATQLAADFWARPRFRSAPLIGQQIAVLGDEAAVFIDPSARVDPFVVLDARSGPIYVDAGASIQAFTRLEGPCYVGRQSQLFRANIREATSIGPVCRVGGEVEASILHGYANKYHDGFLGHSYICPWVNLGAETTNSDLKNDYSTVRVPLSGDPIDTRQMKVGCYVGDHTKTGLGSLFNTGSSIGVMCLVLPAGELLPKHIPSFSRIWHGALEEGLPLERMLDAARHAMTRRDRTLTDVQEHLLRWLHHETTAERRRAIERVQSRAGGTPSAVHGR